MAKSKDNLVFIVEDDNVYSYMLDYMLTTETDYRCMVFETGEECVKNLDLKPKMIILDYALPAMNGKETFNEIKKVEPEIPVILLTGKGDKKIADEFANEGLLAFLNKTSYSPGEIKNIILAYLTRVIESNRQDKHSFISNVLLFSLYVIFIISIIYYYTMKR